MDLYITDLKAKHIRDYYDYKSNGGRLDGKSGGLAHETIKNHKMVLNAMLNYAEATDEVIVKNPAKGILPPKKINDNNNQKERVYLDPEQANKLLKLFENHHLYPLVYITLYYGFRRSEVLGLKWDAVDFENNKLTVKHTIVQCNTVVAKDRTKTETSTRSYKIPTKIIEMLK